MRKNGFGLMRKREEGNSMDRSEASPSWSEGARRIVGRKVSENTQYQISKNENRAGYSLFSFFEIWWDALYEGKREKEGCSFRGA